MDYTEALDLVKGAIFTDRQPCDDCVRRAIMCIEGRGGTGMTMAEAIAEVKVRVRLIRATADEHDDFYLAIEAIYTEKILRKSV